MGMQRMFTVYCDVKDCFEIVDGAEWWASVARARAEEEGWRRVKGKDIRPRHEHEKVASLSFN